MTDFEFYQNCMISAMQGMLEAGGNLGILAELLPNEVAERSMKFADAMYIEYAKRLGYSKDTINSEIVDLSEIKRRSIRNLSKT